MLLALQDRRDCTLTELKDYSYNTDWMLTVEGWRIDMMKFVPTVSI
jgi:hypothetical protein